MANTHILEADTVISSLALASGDTINLDGNKLVLDCDAVNTPVTVINSSGTAKFELRDGGRIKLNASLPANVCPWVDPDNPLPESNYTAGFTANASVEIQLAGAFALGGGPAFIPTATRAGNFWALSQSWPSTTRMILSRDIPLHSGDYLFFLGNNTVNYYRVAGYDSTSREVSFDSAPSNRGIGRLWGLIAGGVVLTVGGDAEYLSSPLVGGTFNVLGNRGAGGVSLTSSSVNVARLGFTPSTGYDGTVRRGVLGDHGTLSARQCICWSLFRGGDPSIGNITGVSVDIGELACWGLSKYVGTTFGSASHIRIAGGCIDNNGHNSYPSMSTWTQPGVIFSFENVRFLAYAPGTPIRNNAYRLANCTLPGGAVIQDSIIESLGTVSRVSRSDFPTDTDIPDAFYFAPATVSDVPFRYEDYWVRKGETLRLSCRAMRGGDNGTARVAIGEMSVWVPAAGMPVLAEWKLDSGEPLVWRGGQVAWTNDTGEDRQVRVWSMGSGINGAYIRVWRATGGAM